MGQEKIIGNLKSTSKRLFLCWHIRKIMSPWKKTSISFINVYYNIKQEQNIYKVIPQKTQNGCWKQKINANKKMSDQTKKMKIDVWQQSKKNFWRCFIAAECSSDKKKAIENVGGQNRVRNNKNRLKNNHKCMQLPFIRRIWTFQWTSLKSILKKDIRKNKNSYLQTKSSLKKR